jgi:hypothetical protein
MKLPPQIAPVVREGHSWPARRSSADGVVVSASPFRTDLDVCVAGNGSKQATWKCDWAHGYQVCKCPNGTCNCCQNGCHPATNGSGQCACN